MKHTMITGHSGFENTGAGTMNSVERAIELGLECVEVDVRMDENRCLRLSHDRMENYDDAVKLEDVMRRIAESGICLNCDLKEPSVLYPVLLLAKKCGVREGQLIFSGSVSCDLLAADERISRQTRIFLNIEEIAKYLYAGSSGDFAGLMRRPWSQVIDLFTQNDDCLNERIFRAAKSVGAETINLPKKLPFETLQALRQLGAELSIWTVNEEDELRRMMRLEPLNITTMQTGTALRVRMEFENA